MDGWIMMEKNDGFKVDWKIAMMNGFVEGWTGVFPDVWING